MKNNYVFEADVPAKKISLSREFDAPVDKVWRAFTEPELLAKWGAPKPWQIKDQTLDFTVGGMYKYAMTGPEDQVHWVYDEFTAIEPGSRIASTGMFCDADGNPNKEGSKSYTETRFIAIEGNRTRVEATHVFDSEDTIKWFVENGFKEGTAATFEQLDSVLEAE
jgi:uncharacterized protein YndB with AHSA1/START domain